MLANTVSTSLRTQHGRWYSIPLPWGPTYSVTHYPPPFRAQHVCWHNIHLHLELPFRAQGELPFRAQHPHWQTTQYLTLIPFVKVQAHCQQILSILTRYISTRKKFSSFPSPPDVKSHTRQAVQNNSFLFFLKYIFMRVQVRWYAICLFS